MSVIIILVIVGIVVAGLFLLGFVWAVKSGQYDDMYSPSVRLLFDDSSEADNEISDKDLNSKVKKK
ncbi:MAG: cbb3-type cytochrome oxidase assembly protein CcoS [Bacteroidota bacterium]